MVQDTLSTLLAHSGHTEGLIMIGLKYCALKALRVSYFQRQPKILLQGVSKQARKLQATLVRNYDRVTYSLTGVKFRATSVAKKNSTKFKGNIGIDIFHFEQGQKPSFQFYTKAFAPNEMLKISLRKYWK